MTEPTILVYMEDSYKFEDNARITEIINEDNQTKIVLDKTIFYPQGGGQPYDQGIIHSDTAKFIVNEVRFNDGIVYHIGTFEKGTSQVGETVSLNIDKERRILNSKLHTAGHLCDEAMKNLGYNFKPEKGYHFPDSPYVAYYGTLSQEEIDTLKEKLEQEIDRIISGATDIKTIMVNRNELEKFCDNIPDYIPPDKPCRVVIFYGEKGTPCGGTHLKNTSNLDKIIIRKISCKKGILKVSYEVK